MSKKPKSAASCSIIRWVGRSRNPPPQRSQRTGGLRYANPPQALTKDRAMASVFQLNTAADYWLEMVVPDCSEYFENRESLRYALHAAISLFHMSDWVFHTHQATVRASFTFLDRKGNVTPVSDPGNFATALEQQCPDYGLIRGIAHAAKHLKLNNARPIPNAPSHASNTGVHPPAFDPKV